MITLRIMTVCMGDRGIEIYWINFISYSAKGIEKNDDYCIFNKQKYCLSVNNRKQYSGIF